MNKLTLEEAEHILAAVDSGRGHDGEFSRLSRLELRALGTVIVAWYEGNIDEARACAALRCSPADLPAKQ